MPDLIVNPPTRAGNQVTVTGTTKEGASVTVRGPGGDVLGSGTAVGNPGQFSITFTLTGDVAPSTLTVTASGKSIDTTLSADVELAAPATSC
jgi:hypothetical protein